MKLDKAQRGFEPKKIKVSTCWVDLSNNKVNLKWQNSNKIIVANDYVS
jgi:hypothetical protein